MSERALGTPPTAAELAAIMERLNHRARRLDHMAFLAGQLTPVELEGLITLATCALADRRSLRGLDEKHAREAVSYALPDDVF